MKKFLMFFAIGLVSFSLTSGALMLFLNDNQESTFQKRCVAASKETPFYRVLEELSSGTELELAAANTETRKTNCEQLFKHARSLKKMNLSGLQLTSIDFLKFFPSVEEVDLSHNNIRNWPEEVLLGNLKSLNVSNNSIFGTKAIARNIRIKKLNIANNPLKRIGSLKKLSKLEYLNLEGTKINNFEDLESFKYLRTIILNPDDYSRASLPSQLKF